jgi:hypothetical protein
VTRLVPVRNRIVNAGVDERLRNDRRSRRYRVRDVNRAVARASYCKTWVGAGAHPGVRDMSVLEAGASPRPSSPGTNARDRPVSAVLSEIERRPGGGDPRGLPIQRTRYCYVAAWERLAPPNREQARSTVLVAPGYASDESAGPVSAATPTGSAVDRRTGTGDRTTRNAHICPRRRQISAFGGSHLVSQVCHQWPITPSQKSDCQPTNRPRSECLQTPQSSD